MLRRFFVKNDKLNKDAVVDAAQVTATVIVLGGLAYAYKQLSSAQDELVQEALERTFQLGVQYGVQLAQNAASGELIPVVR